MEMDKRQHRDRYDVTGNVEATYMDPEGLVLANKPGITDLHTLDRQEELGLIQAYERLLAEIRTDTPMTADLLKYIHQCIFGDLYEWAGRWRTVTISKPGVTWPPPDYLDEAMQNFQREVLHKYPAEALTTDDAFCVAAGEIEGEFLAIHPFREGNARAIKLMVNLLAAQTGRPLLTYDASEEGQQRYINAAKAALLKNYQPMAEVVRDALEQARRSLRADEESRS